MIDSAKAHYKSGTWGHFNKHILSIKTSQSETRLAVFVGVQTIDDIRNVQEIYISQINASLFEDNDVRNIRNVKCFL